MPDTVEDLRSRLIIELESMMTTDFPVADTSEENEGISVLTEALRIARCEASDAERGCFFEGICRKIDVTGRLVEQYSAGFRRPLSKRLLSNVEFIFIGILLLREIFDGGDVKLLNTALKLRGLDGVSDKIQWPVVFGEGLDLALHRVSIL
jgi:hypothetical protein